MISSTQILARVFVYLPPFISQILDFICRTVLIFILIYFEWPDTENQQYFGLEHNWIISLSSWDFKWFWDRSTSPGIPNPLYFYFRIMNWTPLHDLVLCKEIIFVNPYSAKKKVHST